MIDRLLPFQLAGAALLALATGCGPETPEAPAPVETLSPEPAGAPSDVADGRLGCVGNNAPAPAQGGALELTAWVRTYADPDAKSTPPAAQLDAYTASGDLLGSGYTDPGKGGRGSVSVAVKSAGFDGYGVVKVGGFMDWRFKSSRRTTDTVVSAWTWLVTEADHQQIAADSGVTLDAGGATLVGAVHDCDGFGVANVVIVVDGSADGVIYFEGFAPAARTFTAASGRFAVPNLAPGPVTVKAYGRRKAGGALELLSAVTTEVVLKAISAVALEPREK